MADLPSMTDEVYVERVDPCWRYPLCEYVVRLVGADFRPDQAQALADAVDVSINRHNGQVEVEHEHAGCRLWPDTR